MIRTVLPLLLSFIFAFGVSSQYSFAKAQSAQSETLSRIFRCLDKVEDAGQELENLSTTAFIQHEDPVLFTRAVRRPMDHRIVEDDIKRIESGIDTAVECLESIPVTSKSKFKNEAELKQFELKAELLQAKYKLSFIRWVEDSVTKPVNSKQPANVVNRDYEYLDSNLENVGRNAAEIVEAMAKCERELDRLSEQLAIPYEKHRAQGVVLRMACCGDLFLAEKAQFLLLQDKDIVKWKDEAMLNPSKKPNFEVVSQNYDNLTVDIYDDMPGHSELVDKYTVNTKTGVLSKIKN